MHNTNPLHYLGTAKGRRIDQLQTKIHDRLVNECTIRDIGNALIEINDKKATELEICFHNARSSEFYQLMLNVMYDHTLEKAINKAMEIGEYEY